MSSSLPTLTSGVKRIVLSNGLTVLLKESHASPVTAIYVHVKAGYFNEPDRWNGIAHVVEHMMFKGTPSRPEQEQIAREIKDLGGYVNAGTYYEETSYYVVVPSHHLKRALEVHADSIQNSLFDERELTKEIEVIVQESLQKRDNPSAMLIESLNTLAFDTHHLRRWRMGHPETLQRFTRNDLVAFTQTYYRPDNMVLSLVGDFDTATILDLVRSVWGKIPIETYTSEFSPIEREPSAFRFQRLRGETRQRLVAFAFHAPHELHPDSTALALLSSILSDGRSARLYRRLKEDLQIASTAWASYEGFTQMGLFRVGAESLLEDPLSVETALWEEIRRVQEILVSDDELNRVKTRIEARRLSSQEEAMGMARTLATYEAMGGYRLADRFMDEMEVVSAQDIRRVAQTYLQLDRASLLEYLPNSIELATRSMEETESALRKITLEADDSAFKADTTAKPIEISLPSGGKLLYKRRDDLPFISLNVLFRGGKRCETRDNAGITNLLLKSSVKGAKCHSAEEIANGIEGLGSGIGTSLGADYFGYSLKIKRNRLREGFAYLAEVIADPTFPPEEVEREKQAIASDIRRQQDSIGSMAMELAVSACYGEAHPYGLPSNGVAEAVASLTPDDVRAWWRRFVHTENLYVGIVGDISQSEAIGLFEGLLPSAPAQEDPFTSLPAPQEITAPFAKNQHTGKQQTATAIVFPGAAIHAEDRPALDVLTEIASGMGGRFFRTVRGENSLAYNVSCFHRTRQDAGNVVTYTSTAPENADRARDLLLKECDKLRTDLVSAGELASAKASLQGEYLIGRQTFASQSGELAMISVYGLPLDEPEEYLRRVESTTAEQVRSVARKYLLTESYWIGVAVGGEK